MRRLYLRKTDTYLGPLVNLPFFLKPQIELQCAGHMAAEESFKFSYLEIQGFGKAQADFAVDSCPHALCPGRRRLSL